MLMEEHGTGGEGGIDSGHPGPRPAGAVADAPASIAAKRGAVEPKGSNPALVLIIKTKGKVKAPSLCFYIGGEGGIRTLEGLLTLTPLAGARLRPLGHLSGIGRRGPLRSAG